MSEFHVDKTFNPTTNSMEVNAQVLENGVILAQLTGRIVERCFKITSFSNKTRTWKEKRRKNLGARLLMHVLHTISQIDQVTLIADGENQLVEYYQRLGFRKVPKFCENGLCLMQSSGKNVMENIDLL